MNEETQGQLTMGGQQDTLAPEMYEMTPREFANTTHEDIRGHMTPPEAMSPEAISPGMYGMPVEEFERPGFEDPFNRAERLKQKAKVLESVWLYDEEPDARKMVDEDDEFSVYAHKALRKNQDALRVYGRDYARVANPELADMPLTLADATIESVRDDGRRKHYRDEFDALVASGKDTADDYYGLYAKVVRDEVRGGYAEAKKRYEAALADKQRAAQNLEHAVGLLSVPSSAKRIASSDGKDLAGEDLAAYQWLKDSGNLQSYLRAANAAEALADIATGRVAPVAGRSMGYYRDAVRALDSDEAAQEMLLRSIESYARSNASSPDGGIPDAFMDSLFETGIAAPYNLLREAVVAPALAYLEGGEEGVQRNARESLQAGSLSEAVRNAVEAGYQNAKESGEYGRAAAVSRNAAAGIGNIIPFIGTGGIGYLARTMATVGEIDKGVNRKAYEAEELNGDMEMSEISKAGLAQGISNAVGMNLTVGGLKYLTGKGFRLIPGVGGMVNRAASSRGATGLLASGVAGSISTAVDFGVLLPVATGITTGILNTATGVDDRLATGWKDTKASLEMLGDTDHLWSLGIQSALLGGYHAPQAQRAARRSRAAQIASERRGKAFLLDRGADPESVEAAYRSHRDDPAAAFREVRDKTLDELEGNPILIRNRILNRQKIAVNEDNARAALEDKAAKAMIVRDLNIYAEHLSEGKVRIYIDARFDEKNQVEKGKKYYDVDPDVAEAYLGRISKDNFHSLAESLRHVLAGRVAVKEFKKLYGTRGREELITPQTLSDMERDAARARARVAEITRGNPDLEAAALKTIDPDISSELTLEALIALPDSFRHRLSVGGERGETGDATQAYVVPVRLGDGETRYVLRHTEGADYFMLSEELAEQAFLRYKHLKEASGDEQAALFSDERLALDLLDIRDWMREQPKYADAAESFVGLPGRIVDALRNGETIDPRSEDGRLLRHGIVEGISSLFRAGVVSDAMQGRGSLPTWMNDLISSCAAASTEAPRLIELGNAMRASLHTSPEHHQKTVAELWKNHSDLMKEMFEEFRDPTETDYINALEEIQKLQNERDARLGRGTSIVEETTERFLDRAEKENRDRQRAQQEKESVAGEQEQQALGELRELSGNEKKTDEELSRQRVETYADQKEEQIASNPEAESDSAFSGGRCLLVAKDGFADVKLGLLPVESITLSAEVPQWKRGADPETGVVNSLSGYYRPDHDPIRVWQRDDGRLEVISGRHRLAYARQSGATRITAYVYKESQERNAQWARTTDLEQNILDNQASELDIAMYVRGENGHGRPLEDDEIKAAGIDRKGSHGEIGVRLGRFAADEIIDSLRNGQIFVADAVRIVDYAPHDRDVQLEGLRVMRGEPDVYGEHTNGRSISEARLTMNRLLEGKRSQEDAHNAANGGQGEAHFSTRKLNNVNLSRCIAVDAQGQRLDKETFILTPMGNLNWFEFPKDDHTQGLLKKKGIADLPIRLRVGQHWGEHNGFGLIHVLNHFDEMNARGDSPLGFLYHTLTRLTGMYDQGGNRRTFKANRTFKEGSYLIVDLQESDGCYSIVSCYPVEGQKKPRGNELLIGGAVFRFSPNSKENSIESGGLTSQATTVSDSESTRRKAREGSINQEPPSVNIYEITVRDAAGNDVFRQPDEPNAHFSLGGAKAATFGEMQEMGLTYYDPADGQRKFYLDSRGVRLNGGFTIGKLTSVPPGGHRDASLKSILHAPELFRAYPELGDMRVRLYYPKKNDNLMGYYDSASKDGAHIAINAQNIANSKNKENMFIETLLHEAQHAIQRHEGWAIGKGGISRKSALNYLNKAIAQRKETGLTDSWSKDNLAFLESKLADVQANDREAIESVYWLSHGETEARHAERERYYGVDESGLARPFRPSPMTIPVRPDRTTDLGGITFGAGGAYGKLINRLMKPLGDYDTDVRINRMKEVLAKTATNLRRHPAHGENAGLRALTEGIDLITTLERMLPASYGMALHPYKLWLNYFATLHSQSARAGEEARQQLNVALEAIPMTEWRHIMGGSLMKRFRAYVKGHHKEEYDRWFKEKSESTEGTNPLFAKYGSAFMHAYSREKLDRLAAKFILRAKHQLELYHKDKWLGRIRRNVNAVQPRATRDGKPMHGKIAAEAYEKLHGIMRLLEMKKGEYDLWMEANYPEDAPEGKRWEDQPLDGKVKITLYDKNGDPKDYEYTVAEVNTYACFEAQNAERAEGVARAIGELITTGRHAWENIEETRRAETERDCLPLLQITGPVSEIDMHNRRRELAQGIQRFGGWKSFFAPGDNDVQFFDGLSSMREFASWARPIAYQLSKADTLHNRDNVLASQKQIALIQLVTGAKDNAAVADWIMRQREEKPTGIRIVEQEPDHWAKAAADYRRQIMNIWQRKTKNHNFNPRTYADALRYYLRTNGVTDEMRAVAASGERPDAMSKTDWDKAQYLLGLEKELLDKYGMRGLESTPEARDHVHDLEYKAGSNSHPFDTVFTGAEQERLHRAIERIDERAAKEREKWQQAREKKHNTRSPEARAIDELVSRSDGEELVISRAQAANLILLAEQADYAEMMRRKGYTEDVLDRLAEYAGSDMMKVAYGLRDALNERTDAIAEYYERYYGVPFPRVENYFRAVFDAQNRNEAVDALESMGAGVAAGSGKEAILRTRSKSANKRLNLDVDVFGVYQMAMREQSVVLNYGAIGRRLNAILNYKDGRLNYKDAMESIGAGALWAQCNAWAESINWINSRIESETTGALGMLRLIANTSARSILSGRVSSLSKQLTATFNTLAGSESVGGIAWWGGLMRTLSGRGIIKPSDMAQRAELSGRFAGYGVSSVHRTMNAPRSKNVNRKAEAVNTLGMELMEGIDASSNALSACALYDAAYRQFRKQHKNWTHEELDAAAMGEVALALGNKSQPLNHRQKPLASRRMTIWSIGNLFLGGESINTLANVARLVGKGGKDNYLRAANVWLTHGALLMGIQCIYDLLTDDKKQHESRTVWGYLLGSLLGPASGIPFISNVVTMVPAMLGVKAPVYTAGGIIPGADLERMRRQFVKDIKTITGNKKGKITWEDKAIAANDAIRSGMWLTAQASSFGNGKAAAATYGAALTTSAVCNALDFLLKATRTVLDDRD